MEPSSAASESDQVGTAPLAHRFADLSGVRLHYVEFGPSDGPLVLLLHGFPEAWFGWRRQIPALAERGFRVVAPDQRGYNLSGKPRGRRSYHLDLLTRDVVDLIEALGATRASVVGHDWGGIVAWWLALTMSERVERLAIVNAPHPMAMQQVLRRNPRQWLRSAYGAFFQLPWLPEAALRARNIRLLEWTLRASSRPGTFAADHLALYREAWSRPGALTAMLNWYRALPAAAPRLSVDPVVRAPTLVVWGAQDVALERQLASVSQSHCPRGGLVFLEQATHWVHLEEPDRVNALLREFLSSPVSQAAP